MANKALGLFPLVLLASLARADYSTAATGEVDTNTVTRDSKSALDYGQKPSSAIDVGIAHTATGPDGHSATESSHLQVLAEMGRLHAKAETYATQSFLAPNREDGGIALITPHSPDFSTYGGPLTYDPFVGGGWRDVLHVRSATLPYGSLVQYRVHLELHSSVDAYAPLAVASGMPTYVKLEALFGGSEGFLLRNNGGSSTLSVDRVVSASVGDNLDLSSTLKLYAQTSGTPHGAGPSYANIDALNTGTFSLESLTPGATYTTDSGYLYQPVPEPGPFAALGLGAVALLRRRKRK